jgi:hypothetical protein
MMRPHQVPKLLPGYMVKGSIPADCSLVAPRALTTQEENELEKAFLVDVNEQMTAQAAAQAVTQEKLS